jgi:hypothetical protein
MDHTGLAQLAIFLAIGVALVLVSFGGPTR